MDGRAQLLRTERVSDLQQFREIRTVEGTNRLVQYEDVSKRNVQLLVEKQLSCKHLPCMCAGCEFCTWSRHANSLVGRNHHTH